MSEIQAATGLFSLFPLSLSTLIALSLLSSLFSFLFLISDLVISGVSESIVTQITEEFGEIAQYIPQDHVQHGTRLWMTICLKSERNSLKWSSEYHRDACNKVRWSRLWITMCLKSQRKQ